MNTAKIIYLLFGAAVINGTVDGHVWARKNVDNAQILGCAVGVGPVCLTVLGARKSPEPTASQVDRAAFDPQALSPSTNPRRDEVDGGKQELY